MCYARWKQYDECLHVLKNIESETNEPISKKDQRAVRKGRRNMWRKVLRFIFSQESVKPKEGDVGLNQILEEGSEQIVSET